MTDAVNFRSTLKSLSNFSEAATLVLRPYQGHTKCIFLQFKTGEIFHLSMPARFICVFLLQGVKVISILAPAVIWTSLSSGGWVGSLIKMTNIKS